MGSLANRNRFIKYEIDRQIGTYWDKMQVDKTVESISLEGMQLKQIDFDSVSRCRKLKELIIRNNLLTSLNLIPLIKLRYLTRIDMTGNNLWGLNITPICLMQRLEIVNSDSPSSFVIDPIAKHATISSITLGMASINLDSNYATLIEREGMSIVLKRTKEILMHLPAVNRFIAQMGLLDGFGLGELAGYDGNPIFLLDSISDGMNFDEAREAIRGKSIELLEKQITNGGPTFFLNIDELAKSEACILVQPIIEARKREMESVVVHTTEKSSDARILWHTYYGHKIMYDLGFTPYEGNTITLEMILEVLSGAGIDLKVKKSKLDVHFRRRYSLGLTRYLERVGLELYPRHYQRVLLDKL